MKRIALSLLALVTVMVIVAAVVAWRATRVPAWYVEAIDQTPPADVADATINGPITAFQNWYARTATGNVDAKPDAEKTYTLTLTDDEINSLLYRFFDHEHGPAEKFRVRLSGGLLETSFQWTATDSVVTLGVHVDQPAGGDPTIELSGVTVGNQAAPMSLVRSMASGQEAALRKQLNAARSQGRPPTIDEQDLARSRTAEAYHGRLLLDLLAGRASTLDPFLPKATVGDLVATHVSHIDLTDGKLAITFRLLSAAERAALVQKLAGPLPGT